MNTVNTGKSSELLPSTANTANKEANSITQSNSDVYMQPPGASIATLLERPLLVSRETQPLKSAGSGHFLIDKEGVEQQAEKKSTVRDHISNNTDGDILGDAGKLGVHLATPENEPTPKKVDAFDQYPSSVALGDCNEEDVCNVGAFQQLALGKTIEEEAAAFREMLKPFKVLPEDRRQQAVLLLIQNRLKHITTEEATGTLSTYFPSPSTFIEDLTRIGNDKDYSIMAEFWAEIAHQQGMLPKEAKLRIFLKGGIETARDGDNIHTYFPEESHAFFVYDYPGSSGIPAQRYVLDITFADNDNLVTFQEFIEQTGYNFEHEELTDISYSPLRPDLILGERIGPTPEERAKKAVEWLEQATKDKDENIDPSISMPQLSKDPIEVQGMPQRPFDNDVDSATWDRIFTQVYFPAKGTGTDTGTDTGTGGYLGGFMYGDGSLRFAMGSPVIGRKEEAEELLDQATKTDETIAQCITMDDMVRLLKTHTEVHGRIPQLPSNYNADSFSEWQRALLIKRSLGFKNGYWTTPDPNVKVYFRIDIDDSGEGLHKIKNTGGSLRYVMGSPDIKAGEARYLIGEYSEGLDRKLTISDMGMEEDEAALLLGTYSPVLGRQFNHFDLELKSHVQNTEESSLNPLVLPLVEEDDIRENVLEVPNSVDSEVVLPESVDHEGSKGLFNPESLVEDLTTKETWIADAGGALAESLMLTGMAQKRLNKIKKRKRCIGNLHSIPTRWHFELQRKIENELPMEKINNELLMEVTQIQKTDSQMFKDLIDLSYLFQGSDKPGLLPLNETSIYKLFSANNEYVKPEQLKEICETVINIFKADNMEDFFHKQKIEEVKDLKEKILENHGFNDRKVIKKLRSNLKYFGIDLGYNTDKILGNIRFKRNILDVRKSARPTFHRTKLNRRRLQSMLNKHSCFPQDISNAVVETIWQYRNEIRGLMDLQSYDAKKIKHYKRDRNIKLLSAVANAIPVLPGGDILKSAAYGLAAQYRKENRDKASERIDSSIELVMRSCLNQEIKEKLIDDLNHAMHLKQQHLTIKRKQDIANSCIHAASTVISIPASLAGPVGSGIKSGAKAVAKASTSIASAIEKGRLDKKLRDDNLYFTWKDIYFKYKELCETAESENNIDQHEEVLELAKQTFGINKESFKALIKLKLVENDLFKLSFSH